MSQLVRLNLGPRDLSDRGLDNIRAGETLIVRWPDGTSSNEVVQLTDEFTEVTFDSGAREQIPMRRVYFDVLHKGVPVRVFPAAHDTIRVRRPNV